MPAKTKTIELFTNHPTEGVEQVTKIVNFTGFANLQWAELKTVIHANDGISTPLPTEWKITKIVVNGKVFYPSEKTTSTNKVHDSQGSSYFKDVLRVNDTNTISIHWIAPFGAGVISPHGAVSATLHVIGDSIPFAEDLQFDPVNFASETNQFLKNQSLTTALIIIAAIVMLSLIAIISIKAASASNSTNSLVKEVKTLK